MTFSDLYLMLYVVLSIQYMLKDEHIEVMVTKIKAVKVY